MVMPETAVSNDEFTAFWNNVLAAKFERFRDILLEGVSYHSEVPLRTLQLPPGAKALFQLALGPAGEIFRESGEEAERCGREIEEALRAELARYMHDGKVVMQSSSWTITARNPA
jgi:hypothetical protein